MSCESERCHYASVASPRFDCGRSIIAPAALPSLTIIETLRFPLACQMKSCKRLGNGGRSSRVGHSQEHPRQQVMARVGNYSIPSAARSEFGKSTTIVAVACMIGVLFAGSTIATPLYVIYKQRFGF